MNFPTKLAKENFISHILDTQLVTTVIFSKQTFSWTETFVERKIILFGDKIIEQNVTSPILDSITRDCSYCNEIAAIYIIHKQLLTFK